MGGNAGGKDAMLTEALATAKLIIQPTKFIRMNENSTCMRCKTDALCCSVRRALEVLTINQLNRAFSHFDPGGSSLFQFPGGSGPPLQSHFKFPNLKYKPSNPK